MATANETSTYQFRVYEDKAKEWRWQLVADNGKVVADSGEGYATKDNCKRAAQTVQANIASATVVDAALKP